MNAKMKKLIIPLIALAILYSCEKSSEVDVIAEEGLIGVSLRLDKGFAVSNSDSSVDSSWSHIFQDAVDITFSSTTSSYSKTVSFNPNDVSSFPNTSLPYDTYNWSIANTGGSVVVSSALYIYGSSSSAFTVSSASTTIPLTLSTDFALVTVSETNLSSVSISQGGTDTSLTTNNGFYYGYINSAFSDYTVTFTSVENQSASDTITSPSASTHYNYTISYEGGTSVTVALSDTFQLEERSATLSNLEIGQEYQGGVIGYIFQNEDYGFIAGEVHGIIISTEDQSQGNINWQIGTYSAEEQTTYFNITNSIYEEIGYGKANTDLIIQTQNSTGLPFEAANLTVEYTNDGYDDWFLPSIEELEIVYNLRFSLNGLFTNDYYFSSTEVNDAYARAVNFATGENVDFYKGPGGTTIRVRAIRYF